MSSSHAFYATPGPITTPGEYANLLKDLPTSLPELVQTLQGWVVHVFWAQRYGLELSEERKQEVNLRTLRRRLARMLELDPAPLTQARPIERKLVSNCRDHSVMIAGLLMHQGIPARARCGFGAYFMPNHYEDHWVVEYWNADAARWVMFDPQLDDLMRKVLDLKFDTLDMPPGQFITAGEAWLLCRKKGYNPQDFGIFDMHGLDFILGNVYRDLLALNKIEILPWDYWPGMGSGCDTFTPADWEKIDQIAEWISQPEANFEAIRAFYENNTTLRIPADWLE
jgi:hypothetical protein